MFSPILSGSAANQQSGVGLQVTEADDTLSSSAKLAIKAATGGAGAGETMFDSSVNSGGLSDASTLWGDTSSRRGLAQKITSPSTSTNLTKVDFKLKKVNNPTDNLYAILIDSNGDLGLPILATSGTYDASLLTTSYTWVSFTFPGGYVLDPSTIYYVCIMRDGTVQGTDYFCLDQSTDNVYTGGDLHNLGAVFVGSSQGLSVDGLFKLYSNDSVSYITEANDTLSSASKVLITGQGQPKYATFNDTGYNATISNGGLTATHNGNSDGGSNEGLARSTQAFSSGKRYIEFTIGAWGYGDDGAGVCTPSATALNVGQAGINCVMVYSSGNIYSNNGLTSSVGATLTAGDRVDFAIDLGNLRAWFRKNGGNWNNDAGANPATNTGGVVIAATAFAPCVSFHNGGTGENTTINTGQSAFIGTVPSGFNSGWFDFTGPIIEANDTLVANNQQPIAGVATITEAADTVSSASAIQIKAASTPTEANDTVSSASTILVKAAAAITEAGDTVSSTSVITIKANAAITEAGDTVSSTSVITIKAISTVTEAGDTVSSTANPSIKANLPSFSDNFNRSNSSLESSATSSSGRAWVHDGNVAGALTIVSNQLANATSDANGSLYSVDLGLKDQMVSFTILDTTPNSFVVLRCTDRLNYVGVRANGTSFQIWRQVANTFTQVYSVNHGITSGDVITVSVSGTDDIQAYRNGALMISTQIGATLTGTKVGVHARQAVQSPFLDDFFGQTLNIIEAADTLSATSLIAATPIVGSAAITEAGDTVSSTSLLPVKANASITEAGDTVSSVAVLPIKTNQGWMTKRPAVPNFTGLAMSSDASLMVYAGNMSMKFWTSNNKGDSWTLQTTPAVDNVDKIAISDDGSVIVATEYNFKPYYSTDRGVTWSTMATYPFFSNTWNALAISGDGTTVYACNYADGIIYKTTDFGANWTATNFQQDTTWAQIKTNYDGSIVAAVRTTTSSSISLSTNGGTTVNNSVGLPVAYTGLEMSSDGQTIIAYMPGTRLFALVSTDGGTTFENLVLWDSGTGSHDYIMRLSGDASTLLMTLYSIATGYETRISKDLGKNWITMDDQTGLWNYSAAIDYTGKYILAADDNNDVKVFGGPYQNIVEAGDTVSSTSHIAIKANTDRPNVYKATNSGDNEFMWADRVTISGDGSLMMIGEYSDSGTGNFGYVWTSEDQGDTWTKQTSIRLTQGSFFWFELSYDGNVAYVINSYDGTLYKSTDRGVNWTEITAAAAIRTDGWNRMRTNRDGSIIYLTEYMNAGFSTDSGATWNVVPIVLSSATNPADFAISSDGSVIWYAAQNNLYLSTDSGATFNEVVSQAGVNWRFVDCSEDGSTFFGNDSSGFVYYTHDTGATWTSHITAGAGVYGAVEVSDDGQIIYFGGSFGGIDTFVYSLDGGSTWGGAPVENYAWQVSATSDGSLVTTLNYDNYIVDTFSPYPVTLQEDDDTLSSASELIVGRFANASITEANDTLSSTAIHPIVGASSIVEQNDTLTHSGAFRQDAFGEAFYDEVADAQLLIKAALTATEAGDTIASAASLPVKASVAITEASDTVSSSSFITIKANAAITEANDTVADVATITLKANASITEANDTISSTALAPVKASVAITEADDTISSTALAPVKANVAITDADDTLVSAATLPIKANASITEAGDTVIASSEPLGMLTATEADDTMAATAALAIKANASITESGDTVSSAATPTIKGIVAITEAGDTVSSTSTLSTRGIETSTEENDTVLSTAKISIVGSVLLTEANDTLAATANPSVKANAALTEGDDALASAVRLLIRAAEQSTEENDTIVSSGRVVIQSFGSITEADDSIIATSRITINANAALIEDNDNSNSTGALTITGVGEIAEDDDIADVHGGATTKAVLIRIEQDDTLVATAKYLVRNEFKYDGYLNTFTRGKNLPTYSKNANTAHAPIGNDTNEDNRFSYDKYLNNFIKRR